MPDIDARGQGKPPLSDADLLGVFQKMIKQRRNRSSFTTRAAALNWPRRSARRRDHLRLFAEADVGDDVKAAIALPSPKTQSGG